LTVRDVAFRLAVSATVVSGWIGGRQLRAIDVSGSRKSKKRRYRVDPAELDRFLAGRTTAAVRTARRRPRGDYERIV
jgi:hypothetical protein